MDFTELNQFLDTIPFFNPGSRLYYLFALPSIIIAIIFLYLHKEYKPSLKNFKNYILNPSAVVDYEVFAINFIIRTLLLLPFLNLSYFFSKYTIKILYLTFGTFGHLKGSYTAYIIATICAFAFDDFLRFFHHYLMHRFPFLWSIHKTHHSATVLTPMTLFRIHPIESAMAVVRNSISVGVVSGVLLFTFTHQINLITILGINAFAFLFNATFGNFRHTHFQISFGPLEWLFISPKQHQIHHSNKREHYDKNFGVALSIWDQMFGSFLLSKKETVTKFGVDNLDSEKLLPQYFRI